MRLLLSLFTVLTLSLSANAQVVINEIMQSNIDCIMDDLNQFPDSWVEIYNGTESSINLENYSIGLTDSPSEAYQLPAKEVAANGYALIYCDKESQGLHTDFRIDSGKGALYLFSGNDIVDKYEKIAKQPAPNIAYGRKTDGSTTLGYQETPTPGSSNCGKTCKTLLGNPVFSKAGFVFFDSSKLYKIKLSLPEDAPEGTIIRYTTDNSEPTADNGTTYSSAISIKGGSLIIRAKLFCDGYLSPRSTVQSYLYMDHEQTLPVISISTDDKYLNDSKIGIYVEGDYGGGMKNFEYDWRRPMNIEFYEVDGTTQSLNQLGEFRIQGGQSRNCSLKSLALYANKRFGEKRFKYEFFPDQRPGQTNYKSFILRNAGNDFDYLYMRDAIIQRTMASHVDIDWQAWRPAVVFINGRYRGILNIRERSNDDNIFTNYNELEDIDMIENTELKAGTMDKFDDFTAFYTEEGHTLAEYSKWLDIEEFINIYAMNLFFSNRDWPGNNTVMWRPRTDDAVFRIVAKDTDFGLGLYGHKASYNTMAWFYNPNYDSGTAWANKEEHTRLFRHIAADSDFLRLFVDRCAVYMGDFLNYDGVWAIWEPMYNMIKTEYPIHRNMFNPWWPNYNDEINNGKNFIKDRPGYFYKYLSQQYSLGTPVSLRITNQGLSASEAACLHFEINDVPLSGTTFNGKYFEGMDVTISSRVLTQEELAEKGITETPDKQVVGWNVMIDGNQHTFDGSTFTMTMPSASQVVVMPSFGVVDGIENINVDSAVDTSTDTMTYDLYGRQSVGSRSSGIYIQRTKGKKPHKVVIR